MIVELIPEGNLGQAVVMAAAQIVVRDNNGTPICVAAVYGSDNTFKVSKAGDPDFNRTLRELGVHMTVVCHSLKLPGPQQGARLIAGPRAGE